MSNSKHVRAHNQSPKRLLKFFSVFLSLILFFQSSTTSVFATNITWNSASDWTSLNDATTTSSRVTTAAKTFDTTDYLQSPKMVGDSDDNLYVLYRKGSTHNSCGGEIYFSKSTNGGTSWSDPVSIYSHSGDTRADGIGLADNGDIIAIVRRRDASCTFIGLVYKISSDGGSTWGDALTLSPAADDLSSFAGWGKMTSVPEKGLMFQVYALTTGGDYRIYVYWSTDNGQTWGNPQAIYSGSTSYNETSCAYLGSSKILCLARGSGNFLQIESSDNGDTWSSTGETNLITGKTVVSPWVIKNGDYVEAWFADRTDGAVKSSRSLITDVFGNPTSWSSASSESSGWHADVNFGYPAVVLRPTGSAHIIFYDGDGDTDLYTFNKYYNFVEFGYNTSIYTWQCEGSVLPENDDPAWTKVGTELSEVSGGVLHLNDDSTAGGTTIRYETPGGTGNISSGDVAFKTRVKIISSSDVVQPAITIDDGTYLCQVNRLSTDKLVFHDSSEYSIDMTDYHVIEWIKRSGGTCELYIDGSETPATTINATSSSINRITFGHASSAGTGESYWDYVYVSNGETTATSGSFSSNSSSFTNATKVDTVSNLGYLVNDGTISVTVVGSPGETGQESSSAISLTGNTSYSVTGINNYHTTYRIDVSFTNATSPYFWQATLSGSTQPTSTSQASTPPTSTSAPGCGDQPPGSKAPWLYAAIPQDENSIMLYFAEADGPLDRYVLIYGLEPGNYIYGTDNIGGLGTRTFLVQSLQQNTTYYFRIRAGNGCAVGPWSDEISGITHSDTHSFIAKKLETEIVEPEGEKEQVGEEKETKETYRIKVKVVDIEKKPIKEVKVTLFSEPKVAFTDEKGEAIFENVEKGKHKVVIAYKGQVGEQEVKLEGEVREFDFTIQIEQSNPLLNPYVILVITLFATVTISLLIWIFKLKRKKVVT